MVTTIGIVAGHRETVVPENDEHSIFFEILREEGRRLEALPGRITNEQLGEFGALIIGDAQADIPEIELAGIRSWIWAGGHLLLLSSMGGDAANSTNLGDIIPGLTFHDDCLGIVRGMIRGKPFDTRVAVDVSALITQPSLFYYDSGCTLSWTGDRGLVTHTLPAPPGARVVQSVRIAGKTVSAPDPSPQPTSHFLLIRIRHGLGTVTALGSAWFLKNDTLAREDTLIFVNWLLTLWLAGFHELEARTRMSRPQRHRLLHGYPMAPLLSRAEPSDVERLSRGIETRYSRPLIIGVLPHPFCNPAVKGCGFCTFPHEIYNRNRVTTVVDGVIKEISQFIQAYPHFQTRRVVALYFGGGTANLTPPEDFRSLCRHLAQVFDMREAEVTLEGVPKYFLALRPRLMEILRAEIPARTFRISMGIQTFADRQLQRMGRIGFGTAETFREVAQLGQALGFTVSGDLLFNLPGQTPEMMIDDLRKAIACGLEHICLYHLVLFEGLGTEWARDSLLLASLPDNEVACRNWVTLRDELLSSDFVQTTLTNFEQCALHGTGRRFLYEEAIFHPEVNDWIGFGPSAISLIVDRRFDRALKLLNPESSADYLATLQAGAGWKRCFPYGLHDLKLLYLTRKIAVLAINRLEYQRLFGSDVLHDFPQEFDVFARLGFLDIDAQFVRLTPGGMFFADTVAGLLAWRQVRLLRFREMVQGILPQPKVVYYPRLHDDARFAWMG